MSDDGGDATDPDADGTGLDADATDSDGNAAGPGADGAQPDADDARLDDAEATDATGVESERVSARTYVESPIIMGTVRVIAPFVFTFGLFIMFHGADSSGGGFQGGVIVATVVLMLGIAFGIDPTRQWLRPEAVVAVVGLGVAAFLGIGFATVALDGAFLDYPALGIHHASKYGIEFVELAIGVIVASVVTGLFFGLDAGVTGSGGEDS